MSNVKISFAIIYKTVLRLLLLNGIFLFFMTLARVAFLLYFGELGALGGLYLYVFKAFVVGVRFDLSVIAYMNMIATLTLLTVWGLGRE